MSIFLDGVNERKQSTNVLVDVSTPPITMGCWVYWTVNELDKRFCMCLQNDGAINEFLRLGMDASEQVDCRVRGQSAIGDKTNTSASLTVNTWHWIGLVWVDTTHIEAILDTNIQSGIVTDAGVLAPDELEIGNYDAGTTPTFWGGRIAECAVWKRRLVAADFTNLSTNKCSPELVQAQDLVHYVKFEDKDDVDIVGGLTWDVTAGTPDTADHPPGIKYAGGNITSSGMIPQAFGLDVSVYAY